LLYIYGSRWVCIINRRSKLKILTFTILKVKCLYDNQTETFSIWKVSFFCSIHPCMVGSKFKQGLICSSTYLLTCGYMYGSWVKQCIFAPWDTNRCITCGALKYGRVGVDDILSGVMTVRKFGEPGRPRQFSNMHSHLPQPPLATHPYMLMAHCFISLHKISWKTW
jgi:hypothetical protein